MKKNILVILILVSILSSAFIIQADDQDPSNPMVRLPKIHITMNAEYGTDCWFDMDLSNIPQGFDIVNGQYSGWCLQESIFMTQNVNHAVKLFSSYDPDMPENYQHEDWDKINYLINNKNGNRSVIQDVIWYYMDIESYPTDPIAQAMINEIESYGEDFTPKPGQKIAIIVEGIEAIQQTFLELNLPESVPLGDLVWDDRNKNGIQDDGEPGLSDIVVKLYDENQTFISSTTTDDKGYYSFSNLLSGGYYLEFILKENYLFSSKDVGSDDNLDSDADTSTGKTSLININSSINDTSWDAGMYYFKEDGGSGGSGGSGVTAEPNSPPTADATAGEPYKTIEGEELEFNGSLSYDIDGTIVNWSWDFGDGTQGYGEKINHTYLNPGTYNVIFKVIDDDGDFDIYETNASIKNKNRPPSKPIIEGPEKGHVNIFYTYSTLSSDLDNDKIQYTFNWDDAGSSDYKSEFMDSLSYFSAANSWSEPGKYTITVTASDNKSTNSSELIVYIDRLDVLDIGYLIDENSDNVYEIFYNSNGDVITTAKHSDGTKYLIDTDGDENWDHEYNTETGELLDYTPGSEDDNFMLILIVVILIIIIIIIAIILKRR